MFQDGKLAGTIEIAEARTSGKVVVDLGDDWTPYIFSERTNPTDDALPQTYRPTYLALARGEFPNDHHGARAKRDRYLELYGIPPTLSVLGARFREVERMACASKVDLEPLEQYQRIVPYIDNPKARRDSAQFLATEQRVKLLLAKQGVDAPDKLDKVRLGAADKNVLKTYEKIAPTALLVRAAQRRLACEGFFEGKAAFTDGALDWSTNEAIAQFEKKHRVFGWGFLSKDTVLALKQSPMEGERRAVLRVLTERALHANGFLEDGSTWPKSDRPRMFRGKDGKEHPIPNLEREVEAAVIRAFGLETPESTRAWLEALGDLPKEKLVAFEGPKAPEYYSPNMDLSVVIDRGDVWYEFPYDETGKERAQPVQRRPMLTLLVDYLGEKIPLARYGTTVGGWRSEMVDGTEMWKYKNSPVGPRVWKQIVAAPVWLPPPGTTARTLLSRGPSKTGYVVNLHEVGPSYASAYGLVAAYHSTFRAGDDGEVEVRGDEGIRTHGSVDYMSIMQRHSHGCHRLHNHIAVRLMSFVLAHRTHTRLGQHNVGYRNVLEQEGTEYELKIEKSGYAFQLEKPVPVDVLPGRILGKRGTPVAGAIPKYDAAAGAYVTPDGGAVKVDRTGEVTPTETPDAGAPPADPVATP
ncbi:MAG TPA: hypothetical protein VJT73_12855 [Polyangiaceae bacterium]|nr:hypothetical protein [Polyangiaceae bacterium]